MNVDRKEEAYKETYTIENIYALPEGEMFLSEYMKIFQ